MRCVVSARGVLSRRTSAETNVMVLHVLFTLCLLCVSIHFLFLEKGVTRQHLARLCHPWAMYVPACCTNSVQVSTFELTLHSVKPLSGNR